MYQPLCFGSMQACMQVLRAGLVAAQVNYAAKTFPGLIAPAVIAGALAGSGGKIATDILSTLTGLRGEHLCLPYIPPIHFCAMHCHT